MRPFRFVLQASGPPRGKDWPSFARRVESLGYDALYMPDHLGRQLSPIAALATAAASTDRLRVGAFVFAIDYRHPLMLAREMATIDRLSNGRLDVGLGAGWHTGDYRQLGIPYERPGVRIDRLAEAVPIIKRLLAGETVDFEGRHYQLRGARIAPLPVQRPGPPLVIGGGGPRLLRLAAREADVVGLLPQFTSAGRPMLSQATMAETARKVAIVREAAGSRFDALDINVLVADAGLIGGGQPLAPSLVAAVKRLGASIVETPYVLYGTLPQLATLLEGRREKYAINHYAIHAPAMEAMAPLVEALAGR